MIINLLLTPCFRLCVLTIGLPALLPDFMKGPAYLEPRWLNVETEMVINLLLTPCFRLCVLTIGLPALLPDFMKGPAYRAQMAERRNRDDYKSSSDTSDSDEEWTPSMNRKKTKGNKSESLVRLA